ncbi:MAG: type IIL restriction-modification enzyme MmeI [Synechococcus sp.]|nr:type IIL restriction-modification enzyme MmeI [Synechococcus sp.]
MTAGELGVKTGILSEVIKEISDPQNNEHPRIYLSNTKGIILPDLSIGADLTKIKSLSSNSNLCSVGMKSIGKAFQIDHQQAVKLGLNVTDDIKKHIRPYLNGRDFAHKSRNIYLIDLFNIEIDVVQKRFPAIYQYLLNYAKPEREQNRNKIFKKFWWIIGHPRQQFRKATQNLSRYIVTLETSKHRFWGFLPVNVAPDSTLVTFAFDDAFILGVLSSQIHIFWALASGGRLGVGNDPRYNKTRCFDPFPFPDPSAELKQEIRELGERLDSHRKQVQAAHPEVTITAMYNRLEKMRRVEPFTDADREFNNKALISTLKQIHDDLDQAVFRAYGWEDLIPLWQKVYGDFVSLPKGGAEGGGMGDLGFDVSAQPNGGSDLKEQLEQTILQRLVDLNAERAEEERNGFVRWLRPEYQAPDQVITQKVIEGIGVEEETEEVIAPPEQQKFPTKLKDQLATIRDLLRTQGGEWTETQIIAQFKGKIKTGAVQNCLEILEDLGIILSHSEAQTKRYYASI